MQQFCGFSKELTTASNARGPDRPRTVPSFLRLPRVHMTRIVRALLPVLIISACQKPPVRTTTLPWPPIATFSILAMDSATGEIGGAVQSRVFAVGNGV